MYEQSQEPSRKAHMLYTHTYVQHMSDISPIAPNGDIDEQENDFGMSLAGASDDGMSVDKTLTTLLNAAQGGGGRAAAKRSCHTNRTRSTSPGKPMEKDRLREDG